jgi:adenine-specific DNA-methyltransferase
MPNGSIHCFAIDDFEGSRAELILDSHFGVENRLGVAIVKNNPSGRSTAKGFSVAHEYIYFHGCGEDVRIGRLEHTDEQVARYKEKDVTGSFEWVNFRKHGGANANRYARPKLHYPILVKGEEIIFPDIKFNEGLKKWEFENSNQPTGCEIIYPITPEGEEKTWKWGIESARSEKSEFCIKKDSVGRTGIYKKARINSDGTLPLTIWEKKEYSSTEYGTNLLKKIFGESEIFSFPKSLFAVVDCLKVSNFEDGFVLDYFGGSGTTAHSVIHLNRTDDGARKYVLTEIGDHFQKALIPRIKKAVFSQEWKDGKPVARDGISHCFKYLRLESYEDTLNNLSLKADLARDRALADNPSLREDYVLNYWLDVETQGSQSLLNVANFRDPTAYTMRIKQPGSDVQRLQRIDLIETFNWLIGLWVEHMAAPQTFEAEFARETDPLLPKDQNTRLVCKRTKPVDAGPHWFRLVEGYTLKVPGDDTSRQKTLVVWRKLTDNPEQDNAVLQHFLMEKLAISPREQTYAVIYVNGSHTLPNPVVEGENTKVRLIEEAFHAAMWSQDGV